MHILHNGVKVVIESHALQYHKTTIFLSVKFIIILPEQDRLTRPRSGLDFQNHKVEATL